MALSWRWLRALFLAVVGAVLAAVFVKVLTTSGLNGSPCGATPPTHGALPGAIYAGGAVAAFLLGGILGIPVAGNRLPDEDTAGTADFVIHFALLGFLGLTLGALAYETYALATPGLWPITFYVRCANDVAPSWMLGGLLAACFLVGHWLWHPGRR